MDEDNKLVINLKQYIAEKLNMWKRKRRRRRRRRKVDNVKTMEQQRDKRNIDYEPIKTDDDQMFNENKRNMNILSSNHYSAPILRIREASLWIKIDMVPTKKSKHRVQSDQQFTLWVFRLSEAYDMNRHSVN